MDLSSQHTHTLTHTHTLAQQDWSEIDKFYSHFKSTQFHDFCKDLGKTYYNNNTFDCFPLY